MKSAIPVLFSPREVNAALTAANKVCPNVENKPGIAIDTVPTNWPIPAITVGPWVWIASGNPAKICWNALIT